MRSVFLDTETVGPSDLASALRLIEGEGLVGAYRGVEWPQGWRAPDIRMHTHLSLEVLDQCADWLAVQLETLERRMEEEPSIYSPALARVIRYPLLFDLIPWYSRSLALGELRSRGDVAWVWQPATRVEAVLGEFVLREHPGVSRQWKSPRVDGQPDWMTRTRRLAYAAKCSVRARWLKRRTGGSRRRGDRPYILIAECYPNSTDWSLALAHALSEDDRADVAWLAGSIDVAQKLMKRTGTPPLDIVTSPPGAGATVIGPPRSRGENPGMRPRPSASPVISADQDVAGLNAVFQALAPGRLAEADYWCRELGRRIRHIRPDAVVSTTYASSFGSGLAAVSAEQGVPSVYLQHGLFPARRGFARIPHSLALVWSEYEAEIIRKAVGPGTRVVATGPVLYDEFVRRVLSPRREVRSPGRRVAFMASRTGGDVSTVAASRRTLQAVLTACRELNASLTIKVHPSDRTQVPEDEARPFDGVTVERTRGSQDVIMDSDVVIVVSSTTAFEACLAGKPLVVLNLTGVEDNIEAHETGAAIYLEDGDQLSKALADLFSDTRLRERLAEGGRRLVERRIGVADGRAARRAAAALLETLAV